MKKSIIILSTFLATISISVFGFVNWNSPVADHEETKANHPAMFDYGSLTTVLNVPDLVYKVDSRFIWTISKDKLDKAISIVDILPEKATKGRSAFKNVTVSLLQEDEEITQFGGSGLLTADQIKLLQATDYSSNIFIRADYKIDEVATRGTDYYLTYYISVLPEQEAQYEAGEDALIDYLRDNSRAQASIIQKDQLKPGQVSFRISPTGTVEDIELTSTSGYPSVDDTLLELIGNMPHKWHPARNAQGEAVEQTLVFFFGLEGC